MEDASSQDDPICTSERIVIATQAPETRERFERALASEALLPVVGTVDTGTELIELARQCVASIAIVDLPLTDLSAESLLRRLRSEMRAPKVILHGDVSDKQLWELVQLGLRGVIAVEHDHDAIIERVRSVAAGRFALPFLDLALLKHDPFDRLTKKDHELLFALTNNWTAAQICDRLGVSKHTVRYHLKNLYVRLGVSGRRMAIAFVRKRVRQFEGFAPTLRTTPNGVHVPETLRDRSLLIVEDDRCYAERLAKAMVSRGFECSVTRSAPDAIALISNSPPAFAIIDMRLEKGNGLQVVAALTSLRPDARSIVVTGFGNLANAVSAMRLGAFDYLAKPVDPDQLAYALLNASSSMAPPTDNVMSVQRLKWEHVHRIHELCHRNVSETARRLAMHRRTLQRMLAKRAPK